MATRKKNKSAKRPATSSNDEPRESGRAIWKGAITFGLVNIPVALRAATHREELRFRLLRGSDLSPVNYKRVAQADGREVPWDQIVKGYEYEKGKFVVLKDDDFKRVDVEATQTIDIMDFVKLDDINPIYFSKPYYLAPERGGGSAYTLLRDVLKKTGKTGIAKVVIKTRQHLAAVKANGPTLVLELMHFADELISPGSISLGKVREPSKREVEMASALVDQMTEEWDPKRYTDDYTSALMKLIDKKIESGGKTVPGKPKARKAASNVVDLVALLQKSLAQSSSSGGSSRKKKKAA